MSMYSKSQIELPRWPKSICANGVTTGTTFIVNVLEVAGLLVNAPPCGQYSVLSFGL